MRDIKFRGWKPKERIMLGPENGYYITQHGSNDGFELLQFTGLIDFKKQEVYEGDIVKLIPRKKAYQPEYDKLVVGWNNTFSRFDLWYAVKGKLEWPAISISELLGPPQLWRIKVIGNIYQNLELI